ncbi:MAG TPA: HAMP domain-containing sensor histidine kinase [Steroidobacteraceae bacterium]|nr:HAMP domain-containing sensor histidine kinase [Steroidobacteraceae bacterium]
MSVSPIRRTSWVAAAALLWLAMQFALVVWWATVIERQAQHIAELEAANGAGHEAIAAQASRTHVMLVGESSSFLALLLIITALLAWLYWREHRRARSMQAFFASVTHELRTPLTSIRLQAEAIADGQQRAELANRLLEDSSRLESQIDKTLELARIEGGGPLSEQAIPLHAWLARALPGVAAAHGDRLDLRAHVGAELPPAQADSGALQMIVRNLVENSVRHAAIAPVIVRLTASQRGSHVVLEYQDNGRGVAAGTPALGTLFARGANSAGAGVGLYLVRRLMQRMGGEARFDTAPGDGYRCELWFRVSP